MILGNEVDIPTQFSFLFRETVGLHPAASFIDNQNQHGKMNLGDHRPGSSRIKTEN
jgi:hypothetical protein